MRQITINELHSMIQESPDRKTIEDSLMVLFSETDVRKIKDNRLKPFVEDMLPRISPTMFGRGVELE